MRTTISQLKEMKQNKQKIAMLTHMTIPLPKYWIKPVYRPYWWETVWVWWCLDMIPP